MGKLIKNGVVYSIDNNISVEEIKELVNTKIEEYTEDMLKIVDLEPLTKTLSNVTEGIDFYLLYKGKVPDGYTPVEIAALSIKTDDTDNGFPVKRLRTEVSNLCAIVTISNLTGREIEVTVAASVLCIKNGFI